MRATWKRFSSFVMALFGFSDPLNFFVFCGQKANYAPPGFDRKTLVKGNNLLYRLFFRAGPDGGWSILAVRQTLMRRPIALAEYSPQTSHVTVAIRAPDTVPMIIAKRLSQKRILLLIRFDQPMWLAFPRQRPRIQETWVGVPAKLIC